MQVKSDILRRLQSLAEQDGRYRTNAYLFVIAGLDFTLKQLGRRDALTENDRHVTGRELSLGLKDFALQEFGPSAMLVLSHWGVRETLDFGHIVYILISAGLMGKTESDQLEDFAAIYDFKEEFISNYRFKLDNLGSGG